MEKYFISNFVCELNISALIVGTTYGGLENPKVTYSGKVNLGPGVNRISLLSVSVGLPVSATSFLLFFRKRFQSVLGCFSYYSGEFSERRYSLREMERRSSWSRHFEGPERGYKRLDKAEMVVQG